MNLFGTKSTMDNMLGVYIRLHVLACLSSSGNWVQDEKIHIKHIPDKNGENNVKPLHTLIIYNVYHNISFPFVTVKGRIPFPGWPCVKIIILPFTFPIKEYGNEARMSAGGLEKDILTHTHTHTHTSSLTSCQIGTCWTTTDCLESVVIV